MPISSQVSIVRKRGEGSVVGEFGHEGLSSWEFEEFALGRRNDVASAVGLHPPFGLGEVIERVYGEVGVCVVDGGVVAALGNQYCLDLNEG